MEHEFTELNDSGRVYFNGYFKQALAADPGDVASVASRKRWARALLQDCVRASLEWQEREAVARDQRRITPPPLV
jgi:hypothetical protein